jgi:cell division protein FtsB
MKISIVKAAYAFIVLCGIVYAFAALRGPNGIPGLLDKRRQVREYEISNEQLHREIEQKQERIQRLRNDPQEQELEIRQRLKFAGPGE